ncbi:growth hormone receptor isoform X2 [Bombina bombina]|uniref:growth hormone receptor isoform X2 n=1 Tax=Bombina bombina TaxID=8345 RepID=UPI00235A9B83|nr:growth hormone receptor isoform X2 [Bombina bombina]
MGSRAMAFWFLLVTVALVCMDASHSTKEVEKPKITKCRSPQQETFMCYWTYGDFHNLSAPGLLKLQYMKKDMNWTDCPDTITSGENSCYFNTTYTFVWTAYCIQLIHEKEVFDQECFSIDEIVEPDPPIALNWTVLNLSMTKLRMDIKLTWRPPPTVDIKWIRLEYEVQTQEVNDTTWKIMDPVFTNYVPIYALKVEKEHYVRVRCKQHLARAFGEFSEILHIPVLFLQDMDTNTPLLFFIIIAIFGILLVLSFILFIKKKRLKIIIFPPVPVPKIKGIDPDLLQKGKLDEVNFILASNSNNKPQLYSDDWVEFIELDLDDLDDKTEGSDTDRLLGEEHRKSHSCLGVKDDDSGRASCCEPDLPETDFSNSDTCDGTSDTGHGQTIKENEDLLCLDEKPNDGSPTSANEPAKEDLSTQLETSKKWQLVDNNNEASQPALTQLSKLRSKPSMDFYTLVTDITPAGRVLLSPGQRMKTENEECSQPAVAQPANPIANSPYVCESAVSAFCAMSLPREGEPNMKQSSNDDSHFTTEGLITTAMNVHPADKASSCEIPVSDYTSVHIINSPQNLVLNATVMPDKGFLAPCGYMTPDQVNKAMP